MDKPDHKLLKVGTSAQIEWDDASSHDEGWATIEDLQNHVQRCTTLGFVVRKDRKQVLLAMSKGAHASDNVMQYATTMAIPLGWVTRIVVLP